MWSMYGCTARHAGPWVCVTGETGKRIPWTCLSMPPLHLLSRSEEAEYEPQEHDHTGDASEPQDHDHTGDASDNPSGDEHVDEAWLSAEECEMFKGEFDVADLEVASTLRKLLERTTDNTPTRPARDPKLLHGKRRDPVGGGDWDQRGLEMQAALREQHQVLMDSCFKERAVTSFMHLMSGVPSSLRDNMLKWAHEYGGEELRQALPRCDATLTRALDRAALPLKQWHHEYELNLREYGVKPESVRMLIYDPLLAWLQQLPLPPARKDNESATSYIGRCGECPVQVDWVHQPVCNTAGA